MNVRSPLLSRFQPGQTPRRPSPDGRSSGGLPTLSCGAERPPDALYPRGLAVRRSHAGRGHEVLAWAEGAVAAAGRCYLRLACTATNPALHAYYERAGYRHLGHRRGNSLYERAVARPKG